MQKQKSFWDYSIYERDIVAVYMDDGTQLLTYSYDAGGNATIEDAYVSDGIDLNIAYARKNPFRYRGYYYDDTLQLYGLQTRYYDPAIGRFISPDDVSYLGANGDLNSYNLYAYCSNNPVMFTDPTGHSMVLAVLGIGLLIGLIGTAIADYADDGEVFNGSIDALSYAQNASVVALGGLLVYAALPYIGAFLSSSFTFTVPTLASAGTVAVTVTGAQVAIGATVVTTGLLLFARTAHKSNGYYGEGWPGDPHKPDHVHLRGNNTDIRIGRNGKPLQGENPLNPQARKALKKLWSEFLELFNSFGG